MTESNSAQRNLASVKRDDMMTLRERYKSSYLTGIITTVSLLALLVGLRIMS